MSNRNITKDQRHYFYTKITAAALALGAGWSASKIDQSDGAAMALSNGEHEIVVVMMDDTICPRANEVNKYRVYGAYHKRYQSFHLTTASNPDIFLTSSKTSDQIAAEIHRRVVGPYVAKLAAMDQQIARYAERDEKAKATASKIKALLGMEFQQYQPDSAGYPQGYRTYGTVEPNPGGDSVFNMDIDVRNYGYGGVRFEGFVSHDLARKIAQTIADHNAALGAVPQTP